MTTRKELVGSMPFRVERDIKPDAWSAPLIGELPARTAMPVFPVLLVAGLFTRFSALALFVLNAVAVLSYPDISEAGVKEHQYWGILLAVLIAYGGGRLALDRLIQRVKEKRLSHVV